MGNPIESFEAKFGRFHVEASEDNYIWITVASTDGKEVSVRIKADDDGAVVDLWPVGGENEDAHASTWLEYQSDEGCGNDCDSCSSGDFFHE